LLLAANFLALMEWEVAYKKDIWNDNHFANQKREHFFCALIVNTLLAISLPRLYYILLLNTTGWIRFHRFI
jgi:hypothetical protein